MQLVRMVAGAYIVALAIAVGVHFVVTPLYHDGSSSYPVWNVLNWFWAVALILMLSANLHFKLALNRSDSSATSGVTREYLETNVLLYASIILCILFFWKWFDQNWAADPESSSTLSWPFINPPLIAVAAASGLRLRRRARGDAA